MQSIIGEKVVHGAWGLGTIVSQNESVIDIIFDIGIKKMQFPTAFEKFLRFEDDNIQNEVKLLLSDNKVKEEHQKIMLTQKVDTLLIRRAINKEKIKGNIAIKSTFCDGGQDKNNIGFRGVCSQTNIVENIEANRVWCNRSLCADYYNGKLSYLDLLDSFKVEGFVCYESIMLSSLSVGAGYNHTGVKAGTPRYFREVRNNGLLIFTTRLPKAPENERIIYAIAVIDNYFEGDNSTEGRISGSKYYTISLSLDKAKKVKFWDFYYNPSNPENIQFGTGLFRYLTNEQSLQIISRFADVKPEGSGPCTCNELLDYYKKVNGIEQSEIGKINGALKRS